MGREVVGDGHLADRGPDGRIADASVVEPPLGIRAIELERSRVTINDDPDIPARSIGTGAAFLADL